MSKLRGEERKGKVKLGAFLAITSWLLFLSQHFLFRPTNTLRNKYRLGDELSFRCALDVVWLGGFLCLDNREDVEHWADMKVLEDKFKVSSNNSL